MVQRVQNHTGLPDNLKSGIENLSGMNMDHVKVHYNSPKPAQLQAHAYAQGSQIHVAPGQEKHLPHEAWHVVQQAQGRVKPTRQLKGKVQINDDQGLEKEADVMGAKAMGSGTQLQKAQAHQNAAKKGGPVQRVVNRQELEKLVDGLKKRLAIALNLPYLKGAKTFHDYIKTNAAGQVAVNASELLKMAWVLYNVAPYIISSIKGRSKEDGAEILNNYLRETVTALGFARQPWGGGEHENYTQNPEYFQHTLTYPITFLNGQFAGLQPAEKTELLNSNSGFNHQKGNAQLANDLFTESFKAAPLEEKKQAEIVVKASDMGNYLDMVESSPLIAIPKVGETIMDFKGNQFTVEKATLKDFTIKPK
jgi:hypothetical protein